jgi:predicted DNA-binding transcriptional regulator
MSKDQAIGGTIFILCAVIAIFYMITLFYPQWLSVIGIGVDMSWMSQVQFWVIAIPVFIIFVTLMGMGVWIGWTMATTPPPKPIEDIQTEEKEQETAEKEKPTQE